MALRRRANTLPSRIPLLTSVFLIYFTFFALFCFAKKKEPEKVGTLSRNPKVPDPEMEHILKYRLPDSRASMTLHQVEEQQMYDLDTLIQMETLFNERPEILVENAKEVEVILKLHLMSDLPKEKIDFMFEVPNTVEFTNRFPSYQQALFEKKSKLRLCSISPRLECEKIKPFELHDWDMLFTRSILFTTKFSNDEPREMSLILKAIYSGHLFDKLKPFLLFTPNTKQRHPLLTSQGPEVRMYPSSHYMFLLDEQNELPINFEVMKDKVEAKITLTILEALNQSISIYLKKKEDTLIKTYKDIIVKVQNVFQHAIFKAKEEKCQNQLRSFLTKFDEETKPRPLLKKCPELSDFLKGREDNLLKIYKAQPRIQEYVSEKIQSIFYLNTFQVLKEIIELKTGLGTQQKTLTHSSELEKIKALANEVRDSLEADKLTPQWFKKIRQELLKLEA